MQGKVRFQQPAKQKRGNMAGNIFQSSHLLCRAKTIGTITSAGTSVALEVGRVTHKLTRAQAAELAGMERMDSQQELGEREIPIHYTREDLAHDIAFARDQ